MKLKNLLLLFVLIRVFPGSGLFAQDTSQVPEYRFGIGGGAGFTTGYGLSFRYTPGRFGAQLNFAPYSDSQTDRYSMGLTFLYRLIEGRVTNLFLYQGNHYYYSSYMTSVYNPLNPDLPTSERYTERYINNGLGFGIEITMARRIGLNLMTGYAFYDNFRKLNVTGEAALYYKF